MKTLLNNKRIMAKKKIIRVFEGFAGYGGGSFAIRRLKQTLPEIEFKVFGYSALACTIFAIEILQRTA